MGTLNFQLPQGLSPAAGRLLQRAYVAGGMECMPWPTDAQVQGDQLSVRTAAPPNESGCLCAPWDVAEHGLIQLATATLMNRPGAYQLLLELARGKLNHLRAQASDWESGGLQIPTELAAKIREVNHVFAQAVCCQETRDEVERIAQQTLEQGIQVGEELVQIYVEQVFAARKLHQPRLETGLGCRLTGTPLAEPATAELLQAFNTIQIPFHWHSIEMVEEEYQWEPYHALVQWAERHGLTVVGGPLIDLASGAFPVWMRKAYGDFRQIANYMEDFVEQAAQEFGPRIAVWQITSASNWPSVFGLGREELLRLVQRLFDTARQACPQTPLVLGLCQPWGEYLRQQDRAMFPFLFADHLLRSRAPINSLEIEVVMGVNGRGSFVRDSLEVSRLLDLYALLGLPLRVTIGLPSASGPSPLADAAAKAESFGLSSDWTEERQAVQAARLLSLSACKPYVEAVTWTQYSDAESHQFPHCGLLRPDHRAKPVLSELASFRQQYGRA
jgi:hypothetical protein